MKPHFKYLAAITLSALLVSNQTYAQEGANKEEYQSKGIFAALVIRPVLEALGVSLAESIGTIFKKLVDHFDPKKLVDSFDPNKPESKSDSESMSFNRSKGALVPAVAYSLEQLDPGSYSSIKTFELAGQTPRLTSGEVFAIQFATNLPGQVKIENIDQLGNLTELGTYTVLPGGDNRIPRTKGIKLVGNTGLETFKMYFYPCMPTNAHPTLNGKSINLTSFRESLPACGDRAPYQLNMASKGVIKPKGAVNLEIEGEKTNTVAVSALNNYESDDVMSNVFQIDHVPRM